MIEVKRVEIRDRATLVPAIALLVRGAGDLESKDDPLLIRAGFEDPLVVLVHLLAMEVQWDPYAWMNRTMHHAHAWLATHWMEFKDGEVLDIEFILKEKATKKQSECGLCKDGMHQG